ncbi:MAG: 50S ribosomal protein L15 [SAR202 cluster bacterium]|jgi:large subunit ribosomal protein L15|nr:50S ribosomal protein L15 [SAR202 cluster bacterium]
MKQHELKPTIGAKKDRKRVGRGNGSGMGTYSGRGIKGQKSRSGGGVRPGFEGGQNPITKALPSLRGFTNPFRREYSVVNLDRLAQFPANFEVTLTHMINSGIVKNLKRPVKILGRGDLNSPLVVEAHRFTAKARHKIETAGGSVREID